MIIGIVIGIVILLVTIITLSILAATGVFNGSSESYDSPPNTMPSPPSPNQDPKKKINLYQTYYDKSLIPRKVYDNIKTYASNYNHVIFDDNECKSFIEQYYGNKGVDTWNNLKTPAHKADFWRYCILYKYGGAYLDIKVELIKNLDEIFVDKDLVYTIICTNKVNYNNCIMQGILYTPPKNPLFLKLINHCIKNQRTNHYHIFTSYFSKLIKEYSNDKVIKLKNGLIRMKNMPDVYLFQEICTNGKNDCYDGLDKKGLCCFVYDNDEKIIKTRYADYPWKSK